MRRVLAVFAVIGPLSARSRLAPMLLFAGLSVFPVPRKAQAELAVEPPGYRPRSTGVHALTHARIVPRPGVVVADATLVVSNGFIVSVSPSAEALIPAGARLWDSTGLTLYPGFIDPYVPVSGETTPVSVPSFPPIDGIHPSASASASASVSAAVGASGTGAVAGAGAGAGAGANTMASDVSLGTRFLGVGGETLDPGTTGPGAASRDVTPERRIAQTYGPDTKVVEGLRELGFASAQFVPGTGLVRGQGALVSLGDASPNALVIRPDSALCVAFAAGSGSTSRDRYPNSLMGAIALIRQTFFDAGFHAADLAHFNRFPEARSRPGFNTALDALQPALLGQRVIFEPGSVLMIARAARIADELGLSRRAYVASGQEWLRADLMAEVGGPFIVPLAFPALPKFPEDEAWDAVSLDSLRAWDWAPENPAVLRRTRSDVALTTHGLADRKEFRKNLRLAMDRGLTEDDALAALTTVPARICGVEGLLGTLEPGRIANITVVEGSYFDPKSPVRSVWVDGTPHIRESGTARSETNSTERAKATPPEPRVAADPAGARGPLESPKHLLIRNATIWTCGPLGVLTNAGLFVSDGRIGSLSATGTSLPADTQVIDGTGLHLTPGIIDCHSHSMILGGVNEGTLPSTAMVRIGDVVNSESANIHLQLAGGVTTVNLLHGSANPIGGQNCVIKLRRGDGPDELKLQGAPAGIKFALGENVKQSNWGDRFTTRFPQSRMGVPTFHVNRFEAARQYAADRAIAAGAAANNQGSPPPAPVRRDLELEALAEILDGTRLIHCHSYRQDEILAFLRTMESFGVRVATLQHVLEGYKVADEIARHGAGASAFADWWAFKFEVMDAIPYGPAILHERQVLVSINSDSSDHARRLNLEAAKAVKYGGTPEVEALKFVTLNPARQLGIDTRVGSLEPGKDADLVLWSGHPLDTRSVCLMTWVDGRLYFDRFREAERVRSLSEERDRLVAKARKRAKGGDETTTPDKAREQLFFRAWELARHLGVVDCADCQFPNRP
ncbi:MAG: amidohydrolase family protein [Limisphaerales bacterium]